MKITLNEIIARAKEMLANNGFEKYSLHIDVCYRHYDIEGSKDTVNFSCCVFVNGNIKFHEIYKPHQQLLSNLEAWVSEYSGKADKVSDVEFEVEDTPEPAIQANIRAQDESIEQFINRAIKLRESTPATPSTGAFDIVDFANHLLSNGK